MITRVLVSLSSHASNNTSSCSPSSAVSHPVAGGVAFAGQHDPPWPRCSINPSPCKEVFMKKSPVHFSIEWKGREEWASRQQEWQKRPWPKQSRHLNLPALVVHLLQRWLSGRHSWFRYSWMKVSLRGIQSDRRLFCVCTHFLVYSQ